MPSSTTYDESTTPRQPFWPWIARAPLTRIVVFAMLLIGLRFVCRQLMDAFALPASPGQTSPAQLLSIVLLNLFAFGFAYWLMVRWLEQRKLDELAMRKLLPDTAIGLEIGRAHV